MKRSFIFVIIFFFLFLCCDKTENEAYCQTEANITKNTIMPLGASRVEGNSPDYESYRYELWKLITDAGFEFDFVGTNCDAADYPDFNLQSFDRNHSGFGGWTSNDILDNIEDWLNEISSPDIVLFSSPAGNDALENLNYDTAIENINDIIDIIQNKNQNVTIIIEQMAPAQSELMTIELRNFMNQLNDDLATIAASQTNASAQIIIVDMAHNFTDDFLADDVHYNEEGAKFVADNYFEILKDLLE